MYSTRIGEKKKNDSEAQTKEMFAICWSWYLHDQKKSVKISQQKHIFKYSFKKAFYYKKVWTINQTTEACSNVDDVHNLEEVQMCVWLWQSRL